MRVSRIGPLRVKLGIGTVRCAPSKLEVSHPTETHTPHPMHNSPQGQLTKATSFNVVPGVECGVFVCMAAYCLYFSLPLNYKMNHTANFRLHVCLTNIDNKLHSRQTFAGTNVILFLFSLWSLSNYILFLYRGMYLWLPNMACTLPLIALSNPWKILLNHLRFYLQVGTQCTLAIWQNLKLCMRRWPHFCRWHSYNDWKVFAMVKTFKNEEAGRAWLDNLWHKRPLRDTTHLQYCNICFNKNRPLAMSMCCCAFNCINCYSIFFQLESVRCPTCSTNWAPLPLRSVLVAPAAASFDELMADERRKKDIQQAWTSLVVTAFTHSSWRRCHGLDLTLSLLFLPRFSDELN